MVKLLSFSGCTFLNAFSGPYFSYLLFIFLPQIEKSISYYPPTETESCFLFAIWMRNDILKYRGLRNTSRRRTLEMIIPLSDECCNADARAFAELMRNLAEVDSKENTVLMIQVQNETGLLGDSRDRSPRAERAFAEPVPADLLKYLKNSDLHSQFKKRFTLPETFESHSWKSVFGDDPASDEAFMANHISPYVEELQLLVKKNTPF